MSSAPRLETGRPVGKPGMSPQGICDFMCFIPAILLGLTGLAVGVWLGQLGGTWDPTARWTAVLATVTLVSLGVGVWQAWQSARYQHIIQRQFDLQDRQFRLQDQQYKLQRDQFDDYMRPLLIWDQRVQDEDGEIWIIVVRNLGRSTALFGEVTFDGNRTGVNLRGRQEESVSPQCAALVAAVPALRNGTLTVRYFDPQGHSYILAGDLKDIVASCQRTAL